MAIFRCADRMVAVGCLFYWFVVAGLWSESVGN